jgi:hypothetical protein
MKKIIISLVVASILAIGTVGTAVAVTSHSHSHDCIEARPTHFLYMCPVCERTKQVNQSVRPSRNPMCPKSTGHGYMVLVDQW